MSATVVGGTLLLGSAKDDPVAAADAVIVLGGEHDGRERYGLTVARQVSAKTVLLSDPYVPDDPVMTPLCGHTFDGIAVVCRRPEPSTTRGEAMMARRLAAERHWSRIVVVTWRYHLVRARYIFAQCYGDSADVAMRAVPRRYDLSLAVWAYIYAYQFAALGKAAVDGDC